MNFDHIVLLVDDLDTAAQDFETLGFTVLERADTSHGATAFRFISFVDGSYILLTTFTSDAARAGHRLGPVMDDGEGLADYSFTVADAKAAGAALAAKGLPVRGPVAVSNVIATGEAWALDLLMTGRGADGDVALPFVVSDVTGRAARIPGPSVHANGTTGILSVAISTDTPQQVVDTLVALGGTADATNGLRVDMGDGAYVEVLSPAVIPGGRATGGMVNLVLKGIADGELNPALTHGAPILIRGAAQ
ncbi:VOC family protein [Ketogulonicigenium robustum]|nr:VOC family protein [Ketogulonicigenium robustum]